MIKTPCGVIVVKALLSATDDVMRDHVEISDRLTGAELLLYMLVMFLNADIGDWCLAHDGGPVCGWPNYYMS